LADIGTARISSHSEFWWKLSYENQSVLSSLWPISINQSINQSINLSLFSTSVP